MSNKQYIHSDFYVNVTFHVRIDTKQNNLKFMPESTSKMEIWRHQKDNEIQVAERDRKGGREREGESEREMKKQKNKTGQKFQKNWVNLYYPYVKLKIIDKKSKDDFEKVPVCRN